MLEMQQTGEPWQLELGEAYGKEGGAKLGDNRDAWIPTHMRQSTQTTVLHHVAPQIM